MDIRRELGISNVDLVLLGLAAVAGWYLWSKTAATVTATTNAISSSIADIVISLTTSAPMKVTGSLDDMNGNLLGPLDSFPAVTKMYNGQLETFLSVNGSVYELGPRDANGNFTAQPIGTNSGTGTLSPAQSAANVAAANSPSSLSSAWGISSSGGW